MYAPNYECIFNTSWYSLLIYVTSSLFRRSFVFFFIFPFSIFPFPIPPFPLWKTEFWMNYHCRILITNLLWSTCAHFKGYMGGWHLQYRVDSHSTFSCILLHTEIDHPFTCPLLFHSCKPLKFTPVVGTVDKWAGEERPGNDLLEPLRSVVTHWTA